MKEKLDLEEKLCPKYEICMDRKICDGRGNLDIGRNVQACSRYVTVLRFKVKNEN